MPSIIHRVGSVGAEPFSPHDVPMTLTDQTDRDAHRVITPSILYFGTPVVVLSSENADGTANLAPMSSAWALGDVFLLGLGANGHTVANLRARPELVINFPSPDQWEQVESLALLTGANPVPADKPAACRYAPDKFAAAGWHPAPSESVRPPRVAECPAQIEATVSSLRSDASDEFVIVEARAVRVHADPAIVVDGTSHIDPTVWSPLIYNFRHYFGLGTHLGKAGRAEY
jgi:flavin reductase (DIM6/NTAB) family NADH-FMN oxidoreductase RutF